MVIRKRPTGRASHSGRARHSRSYLNGVLYTAQRRSTTYNDIIPVSEQRKRKTLNNLFENFLSKLSKKYAYNERAVRAAQMASKPKPKAVSESIFKDKAVILTTIVCIAVAVTSVFAIPVAFAKNAVTVNVMDSGRTFVAQTTATTVGEFLEKNKIELGSQDTLDTSASLPIKSDMDIVIRRAMPLTIRAGADSKDVNMIAGTVSEALDLAGVQVGLKDEVYPSADSYIRPGMTIDYINVVVKNVTTTRTIGYKEITRKDDSLLKGKKKLVQGGEEGKSETITQETYKNGVLSSSEVISKKTVKEPVAEITAIGTKVIPKPSEVSVSNSNSNTPSGGPSPDQIREVRRMQATAYNDGLRTASGTYPRTASSGVYGTVAADPNILPYGTKLYVEGYGYARVEDTGAFIHWPGGSNVIDLYMNSEAASNNWGRRNVTVYILY